MKAVTCMEWNGVPVNVAKLEQLTNSTKAVRRSVVRAFEDESQAGIHTWDNKGDPHFSNRGYTNWVRSMGFNEDTWLFNDGRASADDKLVLEPMSLLYAERLPVIEEYRQMRKFLTLAKSEFKFLSGLMAATAAACARSRRGRPDRSRRPARTSRTPRRRCARCWRRMLVKC
ncbi:MAG: hypothetical protein WCA27_09610 [Candidatus Sulfotelmatobacter sp.]